MSDLGIGLDRDSPACEDRLGFARQKKCSGSERPVERLDSHTVPGGEQSAVVAIPDSECEHPIQAIQAVSAPQLVRSEHHLGVSLGSEGASMALEFLAKLQEVIDLSVVGDPVTTGWIGHRLRPRL